MIAGSPFMVAAGLLKQLMAAVLFRYVETWLLTSQTQEIHELLGAILEWGRRSSHD
jgi:hypothetical protein